MIKIECIFSSGGILTGFCQPGFELLLPCQMTYFCTIQFKMMDGPFLNV